MNSKLIIAIVIVALVLVIILAAGYFYSAQQGGQTQQNQNNQMKPTQNTDLDTTTNIVNDLNQVPDDASLNGEVNSLDQSLQGL